MLRPWSAPASCHVYTLASVTGVLYTGVTNDLERRVMQHKQELLEGFTKEHEVTRLVYFEPFKEIKSAIRREKQAKAWRREKSRALISCIAVLSVIPTGVADFSSVRASRTPATERRDPGTMSSAPASSNHHPSHFSSGAGATDVCL